MYTQMFLVTCSYSHKDCDGIVEGTNMKDARMSAEDLAALIGELCLDYASAFKETGSYMRFRTKTDEGYLSASISFIEE